ncbi:MAG: SDR family oxidoreductase [Actinobacteria bacterium]|jgi:NAD(P)-dependent dehydrogenase (short-subunit alcohol dehydrogenase family)|nr:SDR family oxidoreductase [Actinomycetota bacterium]MDA8186392.1 SDR family oxidoreductase [Actinomycetota bacterium]
MLAVVGTLEGKTFVVAGAGAGLGRAIALAAFEEGASLVLGARSGGSLEALAREVDPSGALVSPVVFDITDPGSCRAIAEHAAERFGSLDCLVVPAALDSVMGGISGADWGLWHEVMEVNFFGAMYMTSAALGSFGVRGGSIVYITTQTIYRPPPALLQAAYAASKAALLGAARHLAVELGPRRVRVNTVAPGWMYGPEVEAYATASDEKAGRSPGDALAAIAARMPLATLATCADVADAVVFLSSDKAQAITGQALLVNAGEQVH